MRDKILHQISVISPVIAAAASYGINALAAVGLAMPVDYSLYIQLQAWAVYFGSVSGLCLVDLKVSPNGSRYRVFSLLGLSITLSLVLTLATLLFGWVVDNFVFYLVVSTIGFLYAVFRGLLMSGLVLRISKIPVFTRIIRAVLLMLLGGGAVLMLTDPAPEEFMLIQGIAAAIPILVYLPRVTRISFRGFLKTGKIILEIDRVRIARRNISYIVDMIHTPLFFTSIAGLAAFTELSWLVYGIALALPIAFIFNQIVGERVRYIFGLVDLSTIKDKFQAKKGLIRPVFYLFCVFYLLLIVFASFSVYEVIEYETGIMIAVLIQICFICVASFSGVVIAKGGLEVLDLTVNIVATSLMVVVLQLDMVSPILVILASLIVCGKYMAQQVVAYNRLAR